jgi:hypothetical protein
MNNLHRELAPISDAAWAQIEEETTRTLKRYLAGRRVVDVHGPAGTASPPSAPATCGRSRPRRRHRREAARGEGAGRAARSVRAGSPGDRRRRSWRERLGLATGEGRRAQIAFAEDGAIFEGYAAAGIVGIRQGTSNPKMTLPADVREYPEAIAQGLSQLRSSASTAPTRCCSAPTPTPHSPRPATTDTRCWSTSSGSSTTKSSGRPPCRRLRADHPWRRFRPAHRPGRLHRLFQPHRCRCPPVSAGDVFTSCCSRPRPPSRWAA